MVGHNWGSEHAERWIWLHGVGFRDSPEAWLDVALGRVRIAGRLTPWVASGAVFLDGRLARLGGLGARGVAVHEDAGGCSLTVPGPHRARLDARVRVPDGAAAGWRYADPDGGEHDVVNCSVSELSVRVQAPGGAASELSTATAGRTSWACASATTAWRSPPSPTAWRPSRAARAALRRSCPSALRTASTPGTPPAAPPVPAGRCPARSGFRTGGSSGASARGRSCIRRSRGCGDRSGAGRAPSRVPSRYSVTSVTSSRQLICGVLSPIMARGTPPAPGVRASGPGAAARARCRG